MDKGRKKNIKRIIAAVCIALVVALLAAMPLLARQEPEAKGPKASILSGKVSLGSIQTEVIGGGQLAEEAAVTVSVPAAVKLTGFLVENGQTVAAGDALATVDRVTVMTAIIQAQETLEYLSKQIEKAGDTDSEETVTALAGGKVKILYAQAGDSVQNVMLEHGALAVLSLDGLMAVDVETEADLSAGTEVTVTFADGSAATGKIVKNLMGEMTVTLEDQNYAVGEAVTLTDAEGAELGSGSLYIYSPWNATAYAGTVKTVKVQEGDTLSAGKALMVLSEVGYSAAYRQLIRQRQEYEQLMVALFEMYQTETVTAPCDGVVSGIEKNSELLLATRQEDASLQLLSSSSGSMGYSLQLLTNTDSTEETEGTTTPDDSQQTGGNTGGFPSGGMGGGMTGGFPSGGMGGSYPSGGTQQEEAFELYSLDMAQIATVTPQDAMTLEITVDEQDITALAVGMEAQVKPDALGGEKFTATITEIGNTGTNNGGSSKYTLVLTMERAENMLPGMNATATIVLASTADVLTVPAAALVEEGNQTLVYTGYDAQTDTLLDPVAVTVGNSDGQQVEILAGLSQDQSYYYAYYDTPEISNVPEFSGGRGFMFG